MFCGVLYNEFTEGFGWGMGINKDCNIANITDALRWTNDHLLFLMGIIIQPRTIITHPEIAFYFGLNIISCIEVNDKGVWDIALELYLCCHNKCKILFET